MNLDHVFKKTLVRPFAGIRKKPEVPEGLLCKCSQIKVLERFFTLTLCFQDFCMLHLVNTIMLDDSDCCIIIHLIIIFIIPGQCRRADNLEIAILFQFQFFLNSPLCILESDFLVLINCCMNVIHIVINCFILRLRTIDNENIFRKHRRISLTAKLLQFRYQFFGFLLRNKFG